MFKIIQNPTFKHKVRVAVPVNGGHEDQTMEVTYRVIGTSKAKEFDLNNQQGVTDLICAVLERIDDIADANGQALPWNDDVRDQLLELPYVRLAVTKGYFEGVTKAGQGN